MIIAPDGTTVVEPPPEFPEGYRGYPVGTVVGRWPLTLNGLPLDRVDEDFVEWSVTSFNGWGSAAPKGEVAELSGDHGSVPLGSGLRQAAEFTVVGSAECGNPEARFRAEQRLRIAASATPVKLVLHDEVERFRWVQLNGAWDPERVTASIFNFDLTLLAPDPRLYSTTPRTLEAPLPGAGSPPVPHEVPHAVSSGAVVRSATNAGTETAWPVWRLVGPWQNLRLSNPGTGEFMEFRMSLGAGEWLQVTTAPRGSGRGTVLLMGDRDLSRRRDMVGGYWGFGPGETQVIVTGSSPLAGVNQVFATHNDVWV